MGAMDPQDALQKGVYDLLTGDATLMGLVTGVYDGPPEGVDPPYVTIGEATATPGGYLAREGRSVSLTLHTWTRAQSFAPGNAIGGRLVFLLTHGHEALTALVAGHDVEAVYHEYMQTLDDPEPGLRHRLDRFRIRTVQNP